jgi:hypothetical protein
VARAPSRISNDKLRPGTESTKDKIISDLVLLLTIAITAAAMWYLTRKMRQVKPDIIYARRKARQAKLERADFTPYSASNNSSNSVVFNAQGSETNIPLNPTGDLPYGAAPPHQQWDKNGNAIGFVGDPRLHAPAPRRADSGPRDLGESLGTSYPQSKEGTDGRSPLRQESGDSLEWDQQERRDTFDIPRIASPARESLDDPFELAPTSTRQVSYAPPLGPPSSTPPSSTPPASAPSPPVTQTPTQVQYAKYTPQPAAATNVTSPPLPNPFTDATPTQFNHPQVPFHGHAPDATDAGFS